MGGHENQFAAKAKRPLWASKAVLAIIQGN